MTPKNHRWEFELPVPVVVVEAPTEQAARVAARALQKLARLPAGTKEFWVCPTCGTRVHNVLGSGKIPGCAACADAAIFAQEKSK